MTSARLDNGVAMNEGWISNTVSANFATGKLEAEMLDKELQMFKDK